MMAAVGTDAAGSWVRKMIGHYRGAVEMSRIALTEPRRPMLRKWPK